MNRSPNCWSVGDTAYFGATQTIVRIIAIRQDRAVVDYSEVACYMSFGSLRRVEDSECPTCGGGGEVVVNNSKCCPQDPQMEAPYRCFDCQGSGVITNEEKRP